MLQNTGGPTLRKKRKLAWQQWSSKVLLLLQRIVTTILSVLEGNELNHRGTWNSPFSNLVRHATTKLLGIVRWDNTKVNKQGALRLSKLQPKSRNATNLHYYRILEKPDAPVTSSTVTMTMRAFFSTWFAAVCHVVAVGSSNRSPEPLRS